MRAVVVTFDQSRFVDAVVEHHLLFKHIAFAIHSLRMAICRYQEEHTTKKKK